MAMYRIEMNASEARWVVKMSHCVVLWKQIGTLSFENYNEARKWVDQLGLDNIYRDYNRTRVSHIMDGAQDGLPSQG